jgi:AraC-like DNA-binding protein
LRQKLQWKYSQQNLGNNTTTAKSIDPLAPQDIVPDIENAFLQKLRALIEAHITEADLSVEDISRMAGMSYPVVHRKVTALTGLSLTLYVRSIRLQKARILLSDPALTIAEVAYETGFNDPKFFSRVFSESFGMAPSVFRQSLLGPSA